MPPAKEKICELAERLEVAYLKDNPHKKYFSGVAVSVYALDMGEYDEGYPDITVILNEPLPQTISIPEVIDGLRVETLLMECVA